MRTFLRVLAVAAPLLAGCAGSERVGSEPTTTTMTDASADTGEPVSEDGAGAIVDASSEAQQAGDSDALAAVWSEIREADLIGTAGRATGSRQAARDTAPGTVSKRDDPLEAQPDGTEDGGVKDDDGADHDGEHDGTEDGQIKVGGIKDDDGANEDGDGEDHDGEIAKDDKAPEPDEPHPCTVGKAKDQRECWAELRGLYCLQQPVTPMWPPDC